MFINQIKIVLLKKESLGQSVFLIQENSDEKAPGVGNEFVSTPWKFPEVDAFDFPETAPKNTEKLREWLNPILKTMGIPLTEPQGLVTYVETTDEGVLYLGIKVNTFPVNKEYFRGKFAWIRFRECRTRINNRALIKILAQVAQPHFEGRLDYTLGV